MSSSEKVGRLSLWVGDGKHSNAPKYRGELEIGDIKYRISVWNEQSEHPRGPVMTGTVETYNAN